MESAETFDLTTNKPVKRRTNRFFCLVALGILVALVILFVGFLIGYFAKKARTSETGNSSRRKRENGEYDYKKYHEQAVNSLTAESVENFSRYVVDNTTLYLISSGICRPVTLSDRCLSLPVTF